MGNLFGNVVAAALIKVSELRERRWRKRSGYTLPCKPDCHREHIHVSDGVVFWAPMAENGQPGEWSLLGRLYEEKRGRWQRLADWLDDLYQPIDSEDDE